MDDVAWKWDKAGLSEFCKSAGMQMALKNEANKIANSANMAANPRNQNISSFSKPPYAAKVDILSGTAVGVAYSTGLEGARDEKYAKTLSRQNH